MLLVFDLVHVVDGARVSAAGHSVLANRGQNHSLEQALLKAASLAPIALLLSYQTVVLRNARVNPLVLNGPLEESLAALASDDSIVQTRRLVAANHANLRLRIVCHGHGHLLLLLVLLVCVLLELLLQLTIVEVVLIQLLQCVLVHQIRARPTRRRRLLLLVLN